MNPFVVLLTVAFAILIFIFGFGYYAYKVTFYNNPKKRIADPYRHIKNDTGADAEFSKRLIDEMIARPFENVYITSHDGLRLRARLYMQNENAPFAIGMHGYRSTPMLDFSGGGALALSLGLNLILPDQRACGDSEGRTISFGYKESLDAIDWIKYVSERWGEDREIILIGVSLGAGTVITAAGKEIPKNVKGVISDCTFSSAKEIIMKVMRDKGIPAKPLYPFLRLGTMIYGGFDPNKAAPRAFAEKIKVPLLLIHGDDDNFVPPKMSYDVYEKTNMAELHTFSGAGHGRSYIVDTERYEKITVDFISRVLSENTELNLKTKGENKNEA